MRNLKRPHIPERNRHIAIIGDINADLSLVLPFFPPEGSDSTAQQLSWGSGGTAINAAITFAMLGGTARLLGRVGADPTANIALRSARTPGVELSGIQIDTHLPTGLCVVSITPSGQRTFFSYRGANPHFVLDNTARDTLNLADLLYVSAYALMESPQAIATREAMRLLHSQQVPVALDMATSPAMHQRETLLSMLPLVWLLALNEAELRLLLPDLATEAALHWLLGQGVQHIALKRGAAGCTLTSSSTNTVLSPDGTGPFVATDTKPDTVHVLPPVVHTIDTNACGDAFTSGYAWALLHGAAPELCAELANLLGALTSTRRGAAEAIPSYDDLLHQASEPLQAWLQGMEFAEA